VSNTLPKLIAVNGENLYAPASTISAFWSALSAGADTLCLNVFLTQDNIAVCSPNENLLVSCGIDKKISDITYEELQSYDAGSTYHSKALNSEYQPTGEQGDDTPWQGLTQEHPLKNRAFLKHPSLRECFELFSRRVSITLRLTNEKAANIDTLISESLQVIRDFGLEHTVSILAEKSILAKVKDAAPAMTLLLLCAESLEESDIENAVSLEASSVVCNFDDYSQLSDEKKDRLIELTIQNNITWQFFSAAMPYAPDTQCLELLAKFKGSFEAWLSEGVLAASQVFTPLFPVYSESFSGKSLNSNYWSAGYSHINFETELSVDDGFVITIHKGEQYSGGAAICLLPIHGDFDAEVSFHVENPHQATTFELAAIGIDPGYPQMSTDNLSSRTVNLTFDVHGAPPYASSERDQNDGFRCGWNNSFNFAKFGDAHSQRPDKDWIASSSNMYNKYGRDVGDGSTQNPSGKLRLLRRGALFSSYYQDKHNQAWVCSGTMLVQSLPHDAYLRLAAKHWHKIHPAPPNKITFTDFVIRQAARTI